MIAGADEMRAFADKFFEAVAAGDLAAVRAAYDQDAVIWHAHTDAVQTVEENLSTLAAVAKYVKDFRYEDRRCVASETGFVEQHITLGVAPNGRAFRIPSCIVCTVQNGRVTRLDEYFDSAAAAELLGR